MAESAHTPASEPEKDVESKTDEQTAGSGEVCPAPQAVWEENSATNLLPFTINYSITFVEEHLQFQELDIL
jgi:hypothetical protein